MALTWSSVGGKTYRIESSNNLMAWGAVDAGIAGSPGASTAYTDAGRALGGRATFYRVVPVEE